MISEKGPFIAAIMVQLSFAGMFVLSKIAITEMKPAVFVAYRQVISTLFLIPFAFIFSKNSSSPSLSWKAYFKIFIVSLLGFTIAFNLNYAGLKYTSPTFSTAMLSAAPVLVFVMSVCFRIEKLPIQEWYGVAKVSGTLIGFSGAMVFTFFKGPSIVSAGLSSKNTHTDNDWIKGSLLVVVAQIIWSIWLTMQAPLLKQYPGNFRLNFIQMTFSSITSTIYGASMERNMSSWKLGFNISLLSIIYCAIVVNGLTYWLQTWIIDKRGAVFSANFGPVAIVLAAILAAIFLHESLYLGNILGGLLLVLGLYCFLWGSSLEIQLNKAHLECPDNQQSSMSQVEDLIGPKPHICP